jgi:hypothetical protein
METNRKINKIPRRRFLGWIIPLIGSSAIIFSFESIYSGSFKRLYTTFTGKVSLKSHHLKHLKKIREKWNLDSLVLNTQTNIFHYPSEKLFNYYNRIANKHISLVGFQNWETQVVAPKHFIKSKSGIIIESLVLKELSIPISNEMLSKAISTLSLAFSENYYNKSKYQMNTTNWRLYDLLIQFIALNTLIKANSHWNIFSSIIKAVNLKSAKIPLRNKWITSDKECNNRILFIQSHKEEYEKRIEKRIQRIKQS